MNDDVFHNLDGVVETIRSRLIELRPEGGRKVPVPFVEEG
jgi:hypothetical protein